MPPVVEVAGENQRALRVDVMHDVFEDGAVLFGAVGFAQVEVGAEADERGFPAFGQDFAMEYAALFEFVDADVEVVAGFQRQAAEAFLP